MKRARPPLLAVLLACAPAARAQAPAAPAVPAPSAAAPALDPKWLDFEWLAHLMWRADRLEQEGNDPGVEHLCREALLLAPAYEGALERLARRLERGKEEELAIMARLYRAELTSAPGAALDPALSLRLEELRTRAHPPATAAEKEARDAEMELLADLVADDLHNGRLGACEQRLREALRKRPTDPKLLLDLGSVYVRGREWGLCVMLFGYAHTLYGDNPDFANNLGTALAKLERFESALALLDRQLTLKPDSPFLLENCGVLAARLDQPKRALKYFSRWIETDAANPDAWLKYGSVLVKLGPERLAFAKVPFRKVLEMDPGNRMAVYYLAAIEAMRGNVEECSSLLLQLGGVLGPDRMAEILREEPFRAHPALLSVPTRMRAAANARGAP